MPEPRDLAVLLRSWRARAQPAEVGLSLAPDSRRTPGLRREEVAWLSGVSADYVKRIEQGRARPSAAVLRALSRALRLSDTEYELACRLAGHAADIDGQVPRHLPASVQRILDGLRDVPIAVFDAAWTRLQHNDPWAALMGEAGTRGGRSANLVWQHFHGETGHVHHRALAAFTESLVADLRGAAARYPADRAMADLIGALRTSNPEFAGLWEQSTVAHHDHERKVVNHPVVGDLELDCDILLTRDADLKIIVFTAAHHSAAADKLRFLTVLGTEDMAAAQLTGPR